MSLFRTQFSLLFRTSGLLAVVALAALWAMPVRTAFAQETQAPAASAQASGAQAAPPDQSSDDGNAQFLHSSVVKAAARLLHLPLDLTVEILLALNFAVIFFAIAVPIARAMPKMIRRRSQALSQDLNDARKATAEAQARLSAVEAQLAGLGEEIKQLAGQVERDSAEDEKRIKASIAEESARIVAAAEQELAVAAQQARLGLRTLAADLAIGQAEKQIALSAEADRALIAEFAAGIAGHAAGQGGKN